MKKNGKFQDLYDIVVRLRSPGGCPWDRKQTPQKLRKNLIEEAYECIEAIDAHDGPHVREELGDLFLILTMIGRMYEEAGDFSFAEVFEAICAKLIRRHPHVFGDETVEDTEEVVALWHRIKAEQEGRKVLSLEEQVPKSMPPLERAEEIQKKAARVGFEWRHRDDVWQKVHEELDELRAAVTSEEQEQELGDVLFSLVNLARFMKISPFLALNQTNEKFIRRFAYVETRMKEENHEMNQDNLEIMDHFWEEAKGNV